jgi:monoamine oxidase
VALSGGFTHADDGDYLDDAERRRRSLAKQAEARERRLTPDWFIQNRGLTCLPPQGLRVAVVGAGFAGLMAGWYLAQCGVQVTVFEAEHRIGGRVVTDRTFAAPHYVEAGAELIGENHPLWMLLASRFGLPLDPISEYPGSRLRFRGHDLTPTEQQTMDAEVADLQRLLGAQASSLSEIQPWLDRRAAGWDRTSVDAALPSLQPGTPISQNARDWFAFTLGNDNCAPISAQSYLGLLASISAARMGSDTPGMLGYWRSTETHRCRGGNDLLATALAHGLHVQTDTAVVDIRVQPGCVPPVVVAVEPNPALGGPQRRVHRFDRVVLTVPPTVWGAISVTPPLPAGLSVQQGPAVKFITRYPTRFWEQQRPPEQYPTARWDKLGSLWEGTDNQGPQVTPVTPDPGEGPFALSVFSGGPYVQRLADYPGKVRFLYPHAPTTPPPPTLFVDWPHTPFIQTGYAVPAVGQAATVFPAQQQPHAGFVYLAGEQTSHGFFGYMEGALQSGARAARDMLQHVAVPCPGALVAAGSGYRGGGGSSGGGGSTDSY